MHDHLKTLQVLVYAGLAGVALATVIGVVNLVSGAPLQADVLADGASQGVTMEMPAQVAADRVTEVRVEISSPSTRQRVLYGLTHAPTAVVVLGVLAMLALLLRRARQSDPLTAQTVRRLRWTGVLLTTGVVAVAVEGFAQLLLSETITPHRLSASMEAPFLWVLGAFICFAIAEVVQRASLMREDLATVI